MTKLQNALFHLPGSGIGAARLRQDKVDACTAGTLAGIFVMSLAILPRHAGRSDR